MKIDISDLRFRRQVEHLHRLGPRALGEFLVQLSGNGRGLRATLREYQKLTPEVLAIVGGDEWPPLPLHAVEPSK